MNPDGSDDRVVGGVYNRDGPGLCIDRINLIASWVCSDSCGFISNPECAIKAKLDQVEDGDRIRGPIGDVCELVIARRDIRKATAPAAGE
jgi:hypothetical protein